ncbi:CaiB/BaiF CoA transferase family protein [Halomonas korlensis]|uniref:Crotonobetainyl-CoA:carnitine CoA-transferase CaiB n=1 Tax=Halomonas korlensis TaxID=463301 RepID=A0A1I7GIX9_9GAMM|nr:CaiB/BaiF CoA-transferase family protein [Halomonas korlensis]SFU48398.1 Crotonobetainyl-CoA:carnitine CoA-transferase CaiB [Halomonas korlensis]
MLFKNKQNESEESCIHGPLTGCRVIELGSTVAGPFCARLLADFGADVIKIEQKEGDAVRSMGKRKDGRSLYGASILRNKRIVSIDLRTERGRELARDLCEKADVVIENFRPGTLERLGLGYDILGAANPGLILVRISGYGQDGPYSQRPGYGVVCEAVSGIREITGDPDRPPARVATSMTDYITGLYGAFGATMAMVERQHTGRGQVVDSALYEAAFSFMEPHIPAFQQLGHIARRAGPRLPDHTPNSLYTSSEGRHIHITAASQTVFQRLAKVMGKPELLEDPRFATPTARSKHEDETDALVNEWTQSLPLTELERVLDAAAVPASRIFNMQDIFSDPHYRAREMLVEPEDPVLGPVTMANVVPRLSRTPGTVRWAGHDIGQDTAAVLAEELGLSDNEISQLAASEIIYIEPGEQPAAAGSAHV